MAETEARIAKWDQYLDDGQEEPRQKVAKNKKKREQRQEKTIHEDSEKTETTSVAGRATTEEIAKGTETSSNSEHSGEELVSNNE